MSTPNANRSTTTTTKSSGKGIDPIRLKYSEEHLNQFDVFWLRNDVPENRMMINFCFALETKVPLAEVNEFMRQWSQTNPRFQSKVVSRNYAHHDWQPAPNFDPVQMSCLTERRLTKATQEELESVIDQCINEDLPRDSFQWKMVKIDNVPWGGSLIVWKIHHCVCDGVAIVELFQSLFQSESPAATATAAQRGGAQQKRKRPRALFRWKKLGKLICPVMAGLGIGYGLSLGIASSVMIGMALLVVVVWGRALRKTACTLSGWKTPETKTSFKNTLTGVKQTLTLHNLASVAEIKSLAATFSSKESPYTVNDVLCSMVGGAFRRFFGEQGHNVNRFTLRGVLPVSLRSANEPFYCENQFTLVFAPLPVQVAKTKDRLRWMHEAMHDIKVGFEPLAGVMMVKAATYLPDAWMKRLIGFYCKQASVVVTNVNAGNQPSRFCRSLITDLWGWVPSTGGIGVGISLISYLGKLNLGIIADRNQLSDFKKLGQCFQVEWKSMKAEAAQQLQQQQQKKSVAA